MLVAERTRLVMGNADTAHDGAATQHRCKDHRIEAECGLDRLRLEPAVKQVARALGEKIQHVPPLGQRQPFQSAGDFPCPQPVRDAAADVGGRFEQ